MLSFHVRRGLPSVPITLGFPSKICYAFPISSNRSKCPFYLTLLDFIAVIKYGEACCYVIFPSLPLRPLSGPNILGTLLGRLCNAYIQAFMFLIWVL
jgi:hypothetical protein